ncbi:hypothetical protein RA210_U150092 [Rubrivivax sp. A210]|uniref:hypothetical protein n=1 Tax=Rubrivivax sp. A210 TaxID=2772301 RepID=UPI00191B249D|nr:hypothetical protein [Rubrivivax sp. A210]CAD5371451.1 hypothetical protein RA210_U150092 [Rubrivivax sp. A210]
MVGRDELRSASPLVNLSEAAALVPGLVVVKRCNFAQDLQISPCGFGKAELPLRLDNATDRRYAGSVIVNDANGHF